MQQRVRQFDRIAFIGIAILFVIGLLTLSDFGMSTDELANYEVGRDSLKAILRPAGYLDYYQHGEPLAHHGPSYFLLYANGGKLLAQTFPALHIADGRHFMNFITFMFGVLCFYFLAKKLLKQPYALITTAFFATQPLLWGHGFINQKDMPFMVFFLAAVLVGVESVDRIQSSTSNHRSFKDFRQSLGGQWQSLTKRNQRWLMIALGLMLLVGLEFLLFEFSLNLALDLLDKLYNGQAWQPLLDLFRTIAEDWNEAPLKTYVLKTKWNFWMGRAVVLGAMILAISLLGVLHLPSLLGGRSRHDWQIWAWVILAGALFGFAISIRPIAGFIGILIGMYWFQKVGWEKPGLFLIYWLSAALVTYLTWPYLWNAPVQKIINSLLYTGKFSFKMTTYFGTVFNTDELPWHYFPALATIELSEPSMLLFLFGLYVTVRKIIKGKIDKKLTYLLFVWLFTPWFLLLFFKFGVYGNIRHLLFLLVPMLIIVGIGLERIAELTKANWQRGLLFAIVLIPNFIGIIQTHPYEYSYFNSYVGGLAGAEGKFTLDRWCTSYRETMEYLNEVAEENAIITGPMAYHTAGPFARHDLSVRRRYEGPPPETDYFLTCSRFVENYIEDSEWVRIHATKIGGVTLAEVFKRSAP